MTTKERPIGDFGIYLSAPLPDRRRGVPGRGSYFSAVSKFPLFVAFLCAVAGRAAAQVNLLPQGSFEEPGANTGWAEGFNIPNNQEFRVISESGKRWLRIE